MCVFLWASMPVLVPFFTFSCAVLLSDRSLSAADVITTIALLNMLIFPMNAFPWVVSRLVLLTVHQLHPRIPSYDRKQLSVSVSVSVRWHY